MEDEVEEGGEVEWVMMMRWVRGGVVEWWSGGGEWWMEVVMR